MTPIIKLRGVGPALAKVFQENGINTVEDLAALDRAGLQKLPGIGVNRAGSLAQAAKVAVSAPDAANTSVVRELTRRVNGQVARRSASAAKGGQENSEALDAKLAEAEAARLAAEGKAAKAEAKAAKAKRKAANLAEEFAAAKIKAKQKAKKVKAKAKKAIEKEKAKAQAILEGKAKQKGEAVPKKKKKSKKSA